MKNVHLSQKGGANEGLKPFKGMHVRSIRNLRNALTRVCEPNDGCSSISCHNTMCYAWRDEIRR